MSRPSEAAPPRSPVTADDLDRAVQLALATLRQAPAAAWDNQAGSVDWNCWETAEHLTDDLFTYAVQMAPRTPPLDGAVPFAFGSRRAGGPVNAVHVDRSAGPDGLLQALDASGALLVSMARTTPPEVRAYHSFGVSDPEGFTAMGIVETLVHTYDMAEGMGLAWTPPDDICARVLDRLFPDAPRTAEPWPTLLWATGRAELPGHPRLTTWTWCSPPESDRTGA
jgi:hypothetical protein